MKFVLSTISFNRNSVFSPHHKLIYFFTTQPNLMKCFLWECWIKLEITSFENVRKTSLTCCRIFGAFAKKKKNQSRFFFCEILVLEWLYCERYYDQLQACYCGQGIIRRWIVMAHMDKRQVIMSRDI